MELFMGWKSMPNVSLKFLLVAFTLCALTGWAKEPAWRVNSDEASETVPPYTGDGNPFPVRKQPPKQVVEKPKTRREVKAVPIDLGPLRVAGILAELRDIFSSGNFGQPDLSSLEVQGRLLGKNGGAILLRNRWLKVGDQVTVAVSSVGKVQGLLAALDRLDPILAEEMRGELDKRLSESNMSALTITSLSGKSIELKDANNRVYQVSFVRKGL